MTIGDELYTHNNGRQKCSICYRTIPKDVERISMHYSTQWGSSSKRVCGLCILILAEALDRKPIERWKKKVMADKL